MLTSKVVWILQIRKTRLTSLYLSEVHTVIGLRIIQKPTRNTELYSHSCDIKQHDKQVVLLSLTWDKYGDAAGLHPQSPVICMTIFSASLSNLTVLLPQYHVCRCYASWRALRHLQCSECRNALIYAHTPSRTLPICDITSPQAR